MTDNVHISLFSGVGMTDLAVEGFGFKTISTAEQDPFNRKVLQARFPDARHFDDVKKVSVMDDQLRHRAGRYVSTKLLVSGGFPCPDVSSASSTATGLNGARSGLWSEFARVIREFKPDYVLIENVALLRNRGLNVVLQDLDAAGYDAWWDCIPAAAVGAPHLRDRMFIVAKPTEDREQPQRRARALIRGGVLVDDDGALVRLPRAGTLLDGLVWEDEPRWTVAQARRYALKVHPGGLLPTPTRADGSGGPGTSPRRTGGMNLRTRVGGSLHPNYTDWMMGVPEGWTDPRIPNDALEPHKGVDTWIWKDPSVAAVANNPRAIPNRGGRVRAAGNGMVPQAAEVMLKFLMEVQ